MESRPVSRRVFLNGVASVALATCLAGCTKTVTKYRSDGTPYTVEENDPVASLAGVVLLLLLLAAAAASKSKSSKTNREDDWLEPEEGEGRVHSASANATRRPFEGMGPEVSIMDHRGKLLASVDSLERIEHHDLATAERLLASAKVSSLDHPVAVHLRHDRSDSYRIEAVLTLKTPSPEKSRMLRHRIKGTLYEIRVRTGTDNSMRVEMIREPLSNQGVA